MKVDTTPTCHCHGAPVADGARLCQTGTDELAALLHRLTADIARGDREPARDTHGHIRPGQAGRYPSSRWDTPSGEISNLPRMLDEQTARLAVRRGMILGRTPAAEAPLPLDLRAVDAAGHVRKAVAYLSGQPLDGWWTVTDTATWLLDRLDTLRQWDGAWDGLLELRQAVERAERHVDNPPERKYLGICGVTPEQPQDAPEGSPGPVPCQGQVFARDGALNGRCVACKAEHDVVERVTQQEDRLRGVRLTIVEIERVTDRLGRRVSRDTMNTWVRRHRLVSDGGRPARYLVDDVLRLAEQAAARRSRGKVAS